jgi:hypothetical protein
MRADLKSLYLEPDTSTLPRDPAEFVFLARMTVAQPDSTDGETFDITVCTAEWLSKQCRADGGMYDPRHHLVVTMEMFDKKALLAWLEARVRGVEAPTWREVGEQLGRIAHWEFEDYTP